MSSFGSTGVQNDPLAKPGIRRSRFKRVLWGVADQGVSRLSNAVVTVVAARALSIEEFGRFSSALLCYLFMMGIVRAVTGDVFVIVESGRSGRSDGRGASHLLGVAIGMGAMFSALGVLLAVALPEMARISLVVAACMPFLLAQDAYRHIAIAWAEPWKAFALDTAWLGLALLGLTLLPASDGFGAVEYLAVWGATGALSAALGPLLCKTGPRIRGGTTWLKQHKGMGWSLFVEFSVTKGAGYLSLVAIGAALGFGAVAGLRGIQVIFGLLHVALMGLVTTGTAEAVRIVSRQGGQSRLRRFCLALSGVSTAAFAGVTLVFAMLPDAAGQALLGETWRSVGPILAPVALQKLAMAAAVGSLVGLRATGRVSVSSLSKSAGALLSLVLASLGAIAGDIQLAAYGMAAGSLLTTITLWVQMERAESPSSAGSALPKTIRVGSAASDE